MKLPLNLVLALSASTLAAATEAAENIALPTSTMLEMSVHTDSPFDWSGFYAGIFGGVQDGPQGTQAGLGVQAGLNAQFGFYLLGGEVSVQGLPGAGPDIGDSPGGRILGRAGLVIAEDTLIYAAGGYGIELGDGHEGRFLAGGGVERAVSESVSIEAEYLHGFPSDGHESSDQITFGVNWHF